MDKMMIEPGLYFDASNVIYNPDDDWYAEFLPVAMRPACLPCQAQ
jgi:hypothetical protein